jgi:hypothetical protein
MRLLGFGFALLLAVGAGAIAQPPVVIEQREVSAVARWNEATLAAVKAERTPPPVAARNLAIVHVAMYDAVALIGGEYRAFHASARPAAGADLEAAIAVAAHRTLAGLYPCHIEEFDAALDATLDHIPEGPAKTRGIEHGQAVAEQVLKWRADDKKISAKHSYKYTDEAGRWRPTPPANTEPLLPGWVKVQGFAVTDLTAFRPPAPPKLDSDAYAAALREVRSLGGTTSSTRTKEQTEIAHFWADGDGTVTPPGHWNRIAQTVAADRKLTLAEETRLFALLNVALADAAIVCWDCKYRFDVWRPVTAIRQTDSTWMPLLPTPPFPAYTSGHSSFSGAASAALAAFFGTDRVSFSSTSDGLLGVSRSFKSFSSAAEEAGMSRIYGGIHWSFDNTNGLACGREVGEYVATHHFRTQGGRNRDGVPAALPTLRRER